MTHSVARDALRFSYADENLYVGRNPQVSVEYYNNLICRKLIHTGPKYAILKNCEIGRFVSPHSSAEFSGCTVRKAATISGNFLFQNCWVKQAVSDKGDLCFDACPQTDLAAARNIYVQPPLGITVPMEVYTRNPVRIFSCGSDNLFKEGAVLGPDRIEYGRDIFCYDAPYTVSFSDSSPSPSSRRALSVSSEFSSASEPNCTSPVVSSN